MLHKANYKIEDVKVFFDNLKNADYDAALEILNGNERKRIYKLVYGGDYKYSTPKRLRFDLACEIVGKFELDDDKHGYITQTDLLNHISRGNMALSELTDKKFGTATARLKTNHALSHVLGSVISQFYPFCGGSKTYVPDGVAVKVYPLKPKTPHRDGNTCGGGWGEEWDGEWGEEEAEKDGETTPTGYLSYTKVTLSAPHPTRDEKHLSDVDLSRLAETQKQIDDINKDAKHRIRLIEATRVDILDKLIV